MLFRDGNVIFWGGNVFFHVISCVLWLCGMLGFWVICFHAIH